jgi:hypothetical protein
MTDCQSYLTELTYTAQQILDEDLAALGRMPERARIERYNDIKANEQELIYEYGRDCPDFLTASEEDRVRGDCRLARLLIAASFYADATVPQSLDNDFIEAELQAVVDFDRYKQFDILDQEQINKQIRRMEGEVYELVQEYTSTQIGDMDQLIQNPNVQQDVIERLVERYEDRHERIRQGFFTYVEAHGLEHMVEQIESAVEAVADATETREQVTTDVTKEVKRLSESIGDEYLQRKSQIDAELRDIEAELAGGTAEATELKDRLDSTEELGSVPVDELDAGIERVQELTDKLNETRQALETARKESSRAERPATRKEATQMLDAELERIDNKRNELYEQVNQLQRGREEMTASRDRVQRRQAELERRIDNLNTSAGDINGIRGENVVTASTAALFEMDYIGRFDTSIREADCITLPEREFTVPEGYWSSRNVRQNQEPQMKSLLDDKEEEDVGAYPTNQTSRYEVTKSAYMGLSRTRELVIHASVYSHLEAYATNGFDGLPTGLDDVLDIVGEIVREAERQQVHHIVGIASPTGWTDRVHEHVDDTEFARTHYSQYVSVCFVDLRDGSLIYNKSDPLLTDNIELFERAISAEKLHKCVSIVRNEYLDSLGRDTVFAEEITTDHDFESHIVKRAFDRLESTDAAEQLYIEEDGLALHST